MNLKKFVICRRKTIFSQNKNRPTQQQQQQQSRHFLRYDDYVTAATGRLPKNASSMHMTSQRYSYVDLTLLQTTTTTSGNSPTGSSGAEDQPTSADTPLFASASASSRCEPPFFCCECRTSGFDRKLSSGQSTSGSRLARTQRRRGKVDGRDSTMTPVSKVVVVTSPLQTDDVKLCAAQLSSLGGDDDDAGCTSRDDDVGKFASSSGGRNEPAPPRAHIF